MITLFIGNIGSGKTACGVRQVKKQSWKTFYSNINIKAKNCIKIRPEMIIKKVKTGEKRKRDGTVEEIFRSELNKEFWQDAKKPLSIILDETDQFMNARMSMSKTNRILNQWLAMLRRVIGSSDVHNELILITQLTRKMDVIPREMAHKVKYFICHYRKTCKRCLVTYHEHSNMPERIDTCISCGGHAFTEHSHRIHVLCFTDTEALDMYLETGAKTFYQNYFIKDIGDYFKYYDTYQWDDMFEGLY